MASVLDDLTEVRCVVTVFVDPKDPELPEILAEAGDNSSIADVVASEIQSNLESVSYVRHVSVTRE